MIEGSIPPTVNIHIYEIERYLASIWVAIFLLGGWAIWRVMRGDFSILTHFLNTIALISLIIPIYQITSYTISHFDWNETELLSTTSDASFSDTTKEKRPDIYYIILDSYGREDVLQEIYNYDNSEFINALQKKDFFVSQNSYSNYMHTIFSLPSSMNFDYLPSLMEKYNIKAQDKTGLMEIIQKSQIKDFLQKYNYQFISISSGWGATELKDYDIYLSSDASMINQFESILISDTLFGSLFNVSFLYEMQRQRILYIFDTLKKVPTMSQETKFVFAHIIAPHPPFVFGANGEKINPNQHFNFADDKQIITRDKYFTAYTAQLTYINQLVIEMINEIILSSDRPPIIILQGDHGPGAFVDIEKGHYSCFMERAAILNAYFLPDDGAKNLYDSISPVNSFRFILNQYFGENLGLLEDKTYFYSWRTSSDFSDVTNELEKECE